MWRRQSRIFWRIGIPRFPAVSNACRLVQTNASTGFQTQASEHQKHSPSTAASLNVTPPTSAVEKPSSAALDAEEDAALPFAYPADEESEISDAEASQYVFLAYQALFWGTMYCILGAVVVTGAVCYTFGIYSVGELLDKVREKTERDKYILLRKSQEGAADASVKHYDIDLSQPLIAMEQMKEIWSFILSEEES